MGIIRQEMDDLVEALSLKPESLRDGSGPLSGIYEFSKEGSEYWFTRTDGTQYICLDGRTVTIQYTDPEVKNNCPARWPRHLRYEETFKGRDWQDRLLEFTIPRIPEAVQSIAYGSTESPDKCRTSVGYVVDVERTIADLRVQYRVLWILRGGEWEKLTWDRNLYRM